MITLINPQLTEDELVTQVTEIENNIKIIGFENIEVVHWGKRELAYQTNKFNWAYYVKFIYETSEATNNSSNSELTGRIKIKDNVIKFQIHRLDLRTRDFKGNPKKLANLGKVDEADAAISENW